MGGAAIMSQRPDFEEQWRRRFTERGRYFDSDAAIAGWSNSGLECRLRNFQRIWPGDDAGTRWIDVGCGAGSYTRYLASGGIDVIGVDYSRPSIIKASMRVPAGGWLVADARALPVRDQSMDGIICFGVMQALAHPEQAIGELIRVTKPGGQIWIDALNTRFLPTELKRLKARLADRALPLRYDDPNRLADLLRLAGAVDVRIHWVPVFPPRWQPLQRVLETIRARRLLTRWPTLAVRISHAFVLSAHRSRP